MMHTTVLFGTLASVLLGFATTTAQATEPPACDDEKILQKVRMQYEMAETAPMPFTLEVLAPMALGAPPAAANQYATATTFVEISRYCQGIAQPDSGAPDPIWWRIDVARDDAEIYIRVDHCSVRHDVLQDRCEWMKPAQ